MMRLLTTTLFALSLFVGGMNVFVPTTQAACANPNEEDLSGIQDGSLCVPKSSTANQSTGSAASAATSATGGQAPATGADATGDNPTTVTLGDNGAPILTFIMGLFAWLLGIAAVTLDAAVYYTVLTMGTYIKELSAIGITWTILRDIGNIALIFGFLMAGINIILETHFYGEGNKLIPTLIIVAVSLNFSLFVAEAVIDTGNMFATQIYSAINAGKEASTADPLGTVASNVSSPGEEGIGGIIMAQLGLQTIYGNAMTNKDIFTGSTPIIVAFMAIILFLVTAFVLFSLAFILIARFVILILVIITSPIGFIGYAIPAMKSKAELWWHTLFSQTITAPVLMLSLYVALSVITSPEFFRFGASGADGSVTDWTKLATEPASFSGIVLTFLVAMGLLLAVNMIAKELSAFGASGAMKLAGGASFGVAAWAGRNTAGRGFNFAQKKFMGTQFAQRGGILARGIGASLGAGAHASFDVRGSGALKTVGVDAGKAIKGFHDAEEDTKKSLVKYAKDLQQSKGDKQKEEDATRALGGARERLLDIQNKNKMAMQKLATNQAGAMQVFSDRLAVARQELEEAKRYGSAEEIKRAEEALGNRVRESAEQRAKNDVEYDTLKQQHDAAEKPIAEEIQKHEKDVKDAQEAPKKKFADNLDKVFGQKLEVDIPVIGKVNFSTTLSDKTLKSTIKEIKKSKADEAVDALKKAIEGGDHGHDKKDDHGGGAPAAPATHAAPAGGGSTH
jgi:hypothetical protein